MSEKSPFQTTVQAGSFNITVSADTFDELIEKTSNPEKLVDNLVAIEQMLLAKTATTGVVGSPAPAQQPSGYQTAPPPSAPQGGAPTCAHGPMDDLAGKGYKYRYYCTLKTDNWKDKCKPIAG